MRILCLHGRGSNNDIFRMQTAGFRNHLDDYEFDFVQGQMAEPDGNWMIHTKDFAGSKLWGYYNMLDPEDVVRTEREILELIEEDGPYDGVIGYSQGASLALQAMIRYRMEHPGATREEMPFKFAIMFNPATPCRIWDAKGKELLPTMIDMEDPTIANFMLLMKYNPLRYSHKLEPAELLSGRKVVTDGEYVMAMGDVKWDGPLINVPTLHVRCKLDRPEYGQEAFELCDQDLARQYFHQHKHDFPRGNDEMKQIARAIRALAESV